MELKANIINRAGSGYFLLVLRRWQAFLFVAPTAVRLWSCLSRWPGARSQPETWYFVRVQCHDRGGALDCGSLFHKVYTFFVYGGGGGRGCT